LLLIPIQSPCAAIRRSLDCQFSAKPVLLGYLSGKSKDGTAAVPRVTT
jgi:hypothetical protein